MSITKFLVKRRAFITLLGGAAASGYSNKQGAPYSASCIKSMVEGPSSVQLTRR
jgi:hypothetical protein